MRASVCMEAVAKVTMQKPWKTQVEWLRPQRPETSATIDRGPTNVATPRSVSAKAAMSIFATVWECRVLYVTKHTRRLPEIAKTSITIKMDDSSATRLKGRAASSETSCSAVRILCRLCAGAMVDLIIMALHKLHYPNFWTWQMYNEVVRTIVVYFILYLIKLWKSQVFFVYSVWCNISGVAAGEMWNWSLLGVPEREVRHQGEIKWNIWLTRTAASRGTSG